MLATSQDPPEKAAPIRFIPRETIQLFPTNGPARTAWKVRYTVERGPGLVIQGAWLKRRPNEDWIQVLGDARLSEMFVPYDTGSPRFWDLAYNYDMVPITRRDAAPGAKLVGNPPLVAEEIRDRGIHYMDPETGSRRGQTLVLWSVLDATNYRYIAEYGFQDDGTITFRAGSTGRNYPSKEYEGHMHHALWRIDMDLAGPGSQGVYVMERQEPDGEHLDRARTVYRPFNGGKEGFEDWDPRKFTSLHVVRNDKKNARGKAIGYEAMLYRTGTARHFGPEEENSTLHDFWVTRKRPGEMHYQKVYQYVRGGESILDANVVLWISTPHHHEPRTEDGAFVGEKFEGATAIGWSGFDLKPRNFFDGSPHFPPEKGTR
ncbi:MAG: hypothetical protein U0744_06305 [Gemmataceae bacterium]